MISFFQKGYESPLTSNYFAFTGASHMRSETDALLYFEIEGGSWEDIFSGVKTVKLALFSTACASEYRLKIAVCSVESDRILSLPQFAPMLNALQQPLPRPPNPTSCWFDGFTCSVITKMRDVYQWEVKCPPEWRPLLDIVQLLMKYAPAIAQNQYPLCLETR